MLSRSNDGSAGMLFHAQICVWDGDVLKPFRTMVAEEEETVAWEDGVMTQTLNTNRLHVILREQEDGPAGADEILWEKTYEPFPEDAGVFDEMEAHLWEGL